MSKIFGKLKQSRWSTLWEDTRSPCWCTCPDFLLRNRGHSCERGWKTALTDFLLQGVNELRASVQVWKLGRFPRFQSTDIATESQSLAPQFSGVHALIVQKGLKTDLKDSTVDCFFIKALFQEGRRIVNIDGYEKLQIPALRSSWISLIINQKQVPR